MAESWNILVSIAHPDDETGCGGTIARLTGNGHRVTVAVATNGGKGTRDRNVTPNRLNAIRQEEMQETCRRLGVEDVRFLGYEDGTLCDQSGLKERMYRLIRVVRPDILITLDGWRKWEFHPDHRALGQATAEAAYLADGYLYYPEHAAEGLEPWKPREVYLFWSDEPNYAVDVASVLERKWHAADAHVSQQHEGGTFSQSYQAWQRGAYPDEWASEEERFRKIYGTEFRL
jgi:LmbE family N-acetylglucosaminyl deacetylase